MADLETTHCVQRLRTSVHINRKPASNLYHAIRVAEWLGTPLNTFVTVNFELTKCPAALASQAFEHLRRNYFNPWFRRSNKSAPAISRSAYVWVIEAAAGCVALHWVVYIPQNKISEFEVRIPHWLESVGATPVSSNAIDIRPVSQPMGLRRYLLKGINPMYAAFYGVNHVPQGLVHGKRTGFSRGLGPSVRAKLKAEHEPRRRFYHWPTAKNPTER